MLAQGPVVLGPGALVGGRYRIVRQIGQGGMGAVYEAEHVELGRRVAIKLMLKGFSKSPDYVQRFANEARAAAQIGHPGIVDVLDLGSDEHGTYLVMELLAGEELEALLEREGRLDVSVALRLVGDIADAVAAAHDARIVHRDLKPANVFLPSGPRAKSSVKLLDFGIAKLLHHDVDSQTRTGAVFGTLLYMAPEQLRDSKNVDERADVYSMAAILYRALTGRPPLVAEAFPELAFKIASEAPTLASGLAPHVPAWLDRVLARGLEKDPAARFQSAREFGRALSEAGESREHAALSDSAVLAVAGRSELPAPPAPRRRVGLWIVGGLISIGALLLIGKLGSPQAASEPEPIPSAPAAAEAPRRVAEPPLLPSPPPAPSAAEEPVTDSSARKPVPPVRAPHVAPKTNAPPEPPPLVPR